MYSKTCLKQPLKIDKTKILMTNGSLMKVESIADGAFCNTFDLHYENISLKNNFVFFLSGFLREVSLFWDIDYVYNAYPLYLWIRPLITMRLINCVFSAHLIGPWIFRNRV